MLNQNISHGYSIKSRNFKTCCCLICGHLCSPESRRSASAKRVALRRRWRRAPVRRRRRCAVQASRARAAASEASWRRCWCLWRSSGLALLLADMLASPSRCRTCSSAAQRAIDTRCHSALAPTRPLLSLTYSHPLPPSATAHRPRPQRALISAHTHDDDEWKSGPAFLLPPRLLATASR